LTEITWAIERVESFRPGCEQPNLGAESLARLEVERGEHTGLRRPEAVIEGRETLGACWRGDDSPSSPVGRIGAALDKREAIAEMKGREMGVERLRERFGLATPALP
jgi:hypothetical protein